MPPKKAQKKDKAVEKVKQKIVEDRTFGLKNKNKSKVVQKYIDQVKQRVMGKNNTSAEKSREEKEKKAAKEEKEKQEELDKLLRASVVQQKLKEGVDPKSVLCEFFKRGICKKGDKCKFSHDLSIGRKAAKIDMYTDQRDIDKSKEDMDSWDQKTLESVVESKHGTNNKGLPPTTIVCKYFLDAIEKNLYGWFWQCPNGDTCHYRHALPPGFVLKKKKDPSEEEKEEEGPTLEEVLEEERRRLVGGTLVTLETFMEWKKKKIQERQEKEQKVKNDLKQKAADSKGRVGVGLTGRDLFAFNPDMFEDDEGAGLVDYSHREEDEEEAEGDEDSDDGKDEGKEENEDNLDEEELKKHYVVSSTGPIDASLFADLDGLDDEEEEGAPASSCSSGGGGVKSSSSSSSSSSSNGSSTSSGSSDGKEEEEEEEEEEDGKDDDGGEGSKVEEEE